MQTTHLHLRAFTTKGGMMRMRVAVVFTLLACSVPSAGPARASSYKRLTLEELRGRAVAVIRGTVTDQRQEVNPQHTMVWTLYSVLVEETLLGPIAGGSVELPFAGGEAEGLSIGIPEVPTLQIGKSYVFFLNDMESHATPTVGWGQGLYEVAATMGPDHPSLISADGQVLVVTEAGALARSRFSAADVGDERDARKGILPLGSFSFATGLAIPIRVSAPSVSAGSRFATLDDLRSFLGGQINATAEDER